MVNSNTGTAAGGRIDTRSTAAGAAAGGAAAGRQCGSQAGSDVAGRHVGRDSQRGAGLTRRHRDARRGLSRRRCRLPPVRGGRGGDLNRDSRPCTPQRGAGGEMSTQVGTGAGLAPPGGAVVFSGTAGREKQGALQARTRPCGSREECRERSADPPAPWRRCWARGGGVGPRGAELKSAWCFPESSYSRWW